MKKRILAALLLLTLALGACGQAAGPATEDQAPAPEVREEEAADEDLFAALFPRDGNVPTKKEFVRLAKALAEDAGRINEVCYTWKRGKRSMEILSGVRDEYAQLEKPEESPLQLVYGESEFYNYVLCLPQGYDAKDDETKWPVIYFFHGIGESGSDLTALLPYGVLDYLDSGGALDAIVIAPQCPGDSHWADTDTEVEKLKQFVPEMTEKYAIDEDKMYLTGLSMGGRCAWKLALAMPDTFAAIAVVCGRTNSYDFAPIRNMPIWMFHGAQDATVSFDNVNAILPALAEADHRYYKLTVFPFLSHDIWNTVYSRREVYDWLLAQSRSANEAAAKK